MIIFQSSLITFEASSVFEAAVAATKINSKLKLNHHNQVKPVQILYHIPNRLNGWPFIFEKSVRKIYWHRELAETILK